MDDSVYVVTFLTQPGILTVTSGGQVFTQQVSAGANLVTVPMDVGQQKFSLSRNGQVVLQDTSLMDISNVCPCGLYNFNPYVGTVPAGFNDPLGRDGMASLTIGLHVSTCAATPSLGTNPPVTATVSATVTVSGPATTTSTSSPSNPTSPVTSQPPSTTTTSSQPPAQTSSVPGSGRTFSLPRRNTERRALTSPPSQNPATSALTPTVRPATTWACAASPAALATARRGPASVRDTACPGRRRRPTGATAVPCPARARDTGACAASLAITGIVRLRLVSTADWRLERRDVGWGREKRGNDTVR